MKQINIARDFSEAPAGRFLTDGNWTGERFREQLLRRSLSENDVVVVDIDGAAGYGSSFLEEAFGGLVRKGYFTAEQLRDKLQIECRSDRFRPYKTAIWKYIDAARAAK